MDFLKAATIDVLFIPMHLESDNTLILEEDDFVRKITEDLKNIDLPPEEMVIDRICRKCNSTVLIKKLIDSYNDSKKKPLEIIIIPSGIFTNHEDLFCDIMFLMSRFLNTGTSVALLQNGRKECVDVVKMLCRKYNIRMVEQGTRVPGPDEITLTKIAITFSNIAVKLYDVGIGRFFADFSEFGEQPRALFCPLFPYVVRKSYKEGNRTINIHPQLILIAILIDDAVHTRAPLTINQIWNHYLTVYNSDMNYVFERIGLCNKFKVTIGGKFNPSLLALRDHCKARIKELRNHEKIDEYLKKMDTLE